MSNSDGSSAVVDENAVARRQDADNVEDLAPIGRVRKVVKQMVKLWNRLWLRFMRQRRIPPQFAGFTSPTTGNPYFWEEDWEGLMSSLPNGDNKYTRELLSLGKDINANRERFLTLRDLRPLKRGPNRRTQLVSGLGRRGGSSGSGEDHALSDAEIAKLLPGIRIISYPELESLGGRNIENALDGEGRLVILFLTESRTVGHWTCIHATPDGGLECFDAYGLKPEGPKAWLSQSKRIALHEDRPLLSGLIREAEGRGIPVTFNPVPFQKSQLGVATCGRHVVVRLLKRDLDLPAYVRFIASAGGTPDEVVTRITNRLLHNA